MNETLEKVKSGTCKTFAVIGLASVILCVWRLFKIRKASKARKDCEKECKQEVKPE